MTETLMNKWGLDSTGAQRFDDFYKVYQQTIKEKNGFSEEETMVQMVDSFPHFVDWLNRPASQVTLDIFDYERTYGYAEPLPGSAYDPDLAKEIAESM